MRAKAPPPALEQRSFTESLLRLLHDHDEKPAELSDIAHLLGECSRHGFLAQGRRIHARILRSSLEKKLFLRNLLIKMYAACGQLQDAVSVFDRMHNTSRNVITWTLLMDAYIQQGEHSQAMARFGAMLNAGVRPNSITMVCILGAAASLHHGEAIHASIVEDGIGVNVILGTALINMYSRCGGGRGSRSGRWVFDGMPAVRDVVAWNTVIGSYVEDGELDEAIRLFRRMQCSPVEPNSVSFVMLLGICCALASIDRGLSLHAYVVESGFEAEPSITSTLIAMYGKCRSIPDARSVFGHKQTSRPWNVIVWNSMMTAFVEAGHGLDVLRLYDEMLSVGMEPNDVTFINVLGACASVASLPHAMGAHSDAIRHGFESRALVGTTLFDMYGKCGSVRSARKVFDNLQIRDVVTWNAMLSVYVSNALLDDAFALYDRMLAESGTRPDRFTFNTVLGACCGQSTLEQGQRIHADIISYGVEAHAGVGAGVIGMYTKCGSVESARTEFEREQSRDSALWNIMLAGYVRSDMAAQAVELYLDMVEKRVHPDEFTFATVVGACSSLADLAQGKEVHAAVVDDGYETDGGVRNALVHMYSRCGNMSDAWNLFERRADGRDAISWNAMITGYAQHGYGQEALEVYQKMLQQQQKQQQEMEADSATMSGVLLACAHVGLVEDGLGCFGAMLEAHGILPCAEHYAGVVDLLGRAGRVSEAEAVLEGVPIQPDAVMWRVLLGACRLHNEAGPGRRVAARIVELDVHCTLAYVLLSNIFASSSSSSSSDQHLRIPPQQWP